MSKPNKEDFAVCNRFDNAESHTQHPYILAAYREKIEAQAKREGAREALEKAADWYENLGASHSSFAVSELLRLKARALLPPGEPQVKE